MNRPEFAAAIREKYMLNESLDTGQRFEVYDAIFHTGSKLIEHFSSHERILISVSGGSDSDCIVHLVCTYFPEYLDKCHFVFVNTGLEYAATKRHLTDLEQRYGIKIQQIRGKSVVWVVRKYGLPILSKAKSKEIESYMKGQPWAVKRVTQNRGRYGYTDEQREMIQHISQSKIKISYKCCDYSKKIL